VEVHGAWCLHQGVEQGLPRGLLRSSDEWQRAGGVVKISNGSCETVVCLFVCFFVGRDFFIFFPQDYHIPFMDI